MANEKVYAKGLFAEKKQTSFGEITKISIKTADFAQFLQDNTNEKGYVNIDILTSKDGEKLYGVLNSYQPKGESNGNSLPF